MSGKVLRHKKRLTKRQIPPFLFKTVPSFIIDKQRLQAKKAKKIKYFSRKRRLRVRLSQIAVFKMFLKSSRPKRRFRQIPLKESKIPNTKKSTSLLQVKCFIIILFFEPIALKNIIKISNSFDSHGIFGRNSFTKFLYTRHNKIYH